MPTDARTQLGGATVGTVKWAYQYIGSTDQWLSLIHI